MSAHAIVVEDITSISDGTTLLDGVSLSIDRGEFVAIIGRSGAGKTTLLETLDGLRLPSGGRIERHLGPESAQGRTSATPAGYVPQDDIVHANLSVEATIRYAARLRLPKSTSRADIDAVVERIITRLGLADRRLQPVRTLSGGQRKRVSIATELVTEPLVCFLDEPTASLDPDGSGLLVDLLRRLADSGTTVVMTTHDLSALARVDRLVVLAEGGRLVYDGTPAGAIDHFGVDDLLGVYRALAPAPAHQRTATVEVSDLRTGRARGDRPRVPSVHVWRVLTQRNVELIARDRMNAAIMLGSPLCVVAMFAILFEPDAFGPMSNASASTAITYWIAFAAFFFGLTFGLLQICTERAIVRRERFTSTATGPYLLAKITVLGPLLVGVNIVMVVLLSALGRLPALEWSVHGSLVCVLVMDSMAGLALGLLASASVNDSAQAALALPMLCFPAVLFSGAVLPVRSMAVVGRLLSVVTSDRWAFEGVARTLDLNAVLSRTPVGRSIAAEHGEAFSRSPATAAAVLGCFVLVLLSATARVVERRTSATGATRSPKQRSTPVGAATVAVEAR